MSKRSAEFWQWFDTSALPQLGKRATTLKAALEYLDHFTTPISIVETGSMRTANNWEGDGQSSVIFDRYVSCRGDQSVFHTVDIDPKASAMCRATLSKDAIIQTGDSVSLLCGIARTLASTQQTLGLLYLDSFDVDFANPLPSAKHHLFELLSIRPAISPQTLVVVDDAPLHMVTFPTSEGRREHAIRPRIGGKGMLVAEYAERIGAKLVFSQYQAGWLNMAS